MTKTRRGKGEAAAAVEMGHEYLRMLIERKLGVQGNEEATPSLRDFAPAPDCAGCSSGSKTISTIFLTG